MVLEIKQLTAQDATKLTEILSFVHQVFNEFLAPLFSEKGSQTFQQTTDDAAILQQIQAKQTFLWCGYLNNQLAGVIAVRKPNHIFLLFVDKKHQRKKVATTLIEFGSNYCQTHFQAHSLTVRASSYALESYQKLRFIATEPQQEKEGIIFTPMTKHI